MIQPWMRRALCRHADPDIWWPAPNAPIRDAQAKRVAKAICAACPVHAECLRYAVDLGEDRGIWGGVDFFTVDLIKRRTA